MKFVIFGTGGVGGYFGGRLAQAGEDVTFIARGVNLSAITETGLRVDSIEGDFLVKPAVATDSPESIDPVGVVILAVKAWQLQESLGQLHSLIKNETVILPLLNGVDHIDLLRNEFGDEHLLVGLCRISSFLVGPGHVKHVGVQPYIAFGELDNRKSARIDALHRIFKKLTGVASEVPANIGLALWEKFLMICAFSGVGAVTRQPIGGFRAVPETRKMFRRALEEVVAVANARGIELTQGSVQSVVERLDSTQPDMLASMQKDIMEDRPSELEAQTGALVRMGHALDVSTPTHEFIYASLLPMELRARGK